MYFTNKQGASTPYPRSFLHKFRGGGAVQKVGGGGGGGGRRLGVGMNGGVGVFDKEYPS